MIRANHIVGNFQFACSAGTGGGGIEIGGAANAQVIGNLIENNNGGNGGGGGIALDAAGTPTTMKGTFEGNTSTTTGGGISGYNVRTPSWCKTCSIENSSPQGGAVVPALWETASFCAGR